MNYRQGHFEDLEKLKQLAIVSWEEFQTVLTTENWEKLSGTITDSKTYADMLERSHCIVCETKNKEIIGMAFLVPKGNPTEIYDEKWSYIRFVSVNPLFGGQGIGRKLTERCGVVA